MIIQMIYQMSGSRYDDRMWPLPWHDFEVPDEEGRGLIRCGAAMEVVQPAKPPAPEPPPVRKPEPVPEVLVSKAEPEVLVSKAEAPKPEVPELPQQPTPSDPKAAWVEYAVSMGAARSEAEDKTKAQLQAAYGGRL